MKKISIILSSLLLCLSLCACSAQGFNKNELLKSEYMGAEMNPDISLRLRPQELQRGSGFVDLHFKNSAATDFSFDEGRRLEVNIDGCWYIVPDKSPAVNLGLYYLPAGDSAEFRLQLEGHYSSLPDGRYRIVKCFYDSAGRKSLASAEFDIK